MRNDHFFPWRGLQLGTAMLCLSAVSVIGQETNPPAVNVRAWGRNDYGQTNVPPNLTNAIAVAGGNWFSAALRADGTIVGWGRNDTGECSAPSNLTNAIAIAAGGSHCLALTDGGLVRAWGQSAYGATDVPPTLSNVVAVAAGTFHNLAMRADGTVTAWGNNESGQTNVPPDLTNVVAVAAGYAHSLALRADGTVIAWGSSDIGATNVPADLMNVVAVAAGDWHGLALRDNGIVIAWGIPAEVPPDLTDVVAIAAGTGHSLALRADGTMVAWGSLNEFGECTPPLGLPRVTAVSGGYQHTVVLVDPSQAGAAPTIVAFPRSQTATIGSTAHFSVRAVGFPPLSYQWYFGTNVSTGATSALLTLTNLQPEQSGEYTVVVTNPAGSTTSPPAMLSVLPALEVNMVPAITLDGGVGLTYRLEFINAVGHTNAWEALANLLITNQPQYYFDLSAIGQPRRFYRLVELP